MKKLIREERSDAQLSESKKTAKARLKSLNKQVQAHQARSEEGTAYSAFCCGTASASR